MVNPPQASGKLTQFLPLFKSLLILTTALALIGWWYYTPPGLLGKADAAGYAVCHRIASRSFLIGDRQTPLWHGEKLYAEAVNSPNRKLKVFSLADGGAEHCQADNATLAADCMSDWVAEVLGGNPKGI
jgi:hypothetical protein